jgi:hypothetical protein
VKENRRSLYAQVKTVPWPSIPAASRQHGRGGVLARLQPRLGPREVWPQRCVGIQGPSPDGRPGLQHATRQDPSAEPERRSQKVIRQKPYAG